MSGFKSWLDGVMNDTFRAMIIAFFPDLIRLGVLFGWEPTADETQNIMSALSKVVVIIFFLYKGGQNQGEGGQSLTQQHNKKKASE